MLHACRLTPAYGLLFDSAASVEGDDTDDFDQSAHTLADTPKQQCHNYPEVPYATLSAACARQTRQEHHNIKLREDIGALGRTHILHTHSDSEEMYIALLSYAITT